MRRDELLSNITYCTAFGAARLRPYQASPSSAGGLSTLKRTRGHIAGILAGSLCFSPLEMGVEPKEGKTPTPKKARKETESTAELAPLLEKDPAVQELTVCRRIEGPLDLGRHECLVAFTLHPPHPWRDASGFPSLSVVRRHTEAGRDSLEG